MFNIKPNIARQFQVIDEETANELWTAIKKRYHRANHAQMIAIESQLANLKIHDTPNIMDQITQFITLQKELVSLGSKSTEVEFVHRLMIKLPESFSAFCDTISLLPNTPDMNTFLGMLQDRATRKKSAQTSNETLLHAKSGPTTSTIDEWLVDSGATGHMTYDKSILHDLKPSSSQISIGDASSIEASCVGNVFLNTSSNAEPAVLQDVLHVPRISPNYFQSTESQTRLLCLLY